MKITIYELLGLIKDGKAPKEVKYKETKYVFNNDRQCYENSYEWFPSIQEIGLNDEVEILDEEKFIDIEEITLNGEKLGYGVLSEWLGSKQTDNEVKLCSSIECLGITLNLLIKNQKKIIERLK